MIYKGSNQLVDGNLRKFIFRGSSFIERIYRGSSLIHEALPRRIAIEGCGVNYLNGLYGWNLQPHSATNGTRTYHKIQHTGQGQESLVNPGPIIFTNGNPGAGQSLELALRTAAAPLTTQYLSGNFSTWFTDGSPNPAPSSTFSYGANDSIVEFYLDAVFGTEWFVRSGNFFEFTLNTDGAIYTYLDTDESFATDGVILWDDNIGEPLATVQMDYFPGAGPGLWGAVTGYEANFPGAFQARGLTLGPV